MVNQNIQIKLIKNSKKQSNSINQIIGKKK